MKIAKKKKKQREDPEGNQVELVRGKRFTKEEDELINKAVFEYVEAHVLGDQGVDMVMNCRSHPQVKGCWKEITHALPWRPYSAVYCRAHSLFEEGSKGLWSKEDFELVKEHQKKHGNHWKTLARWSREEYQNLFDLVNKDLRKKAFQKKRSQHRMLRDNICWIWI
ncbi:myb family transcription factor [Raphanus sativus]|nr:myb family transcription factor [Raphanus sativus]